MHNHTTILVVITALCAAARADELAKVDLFAAGDGGYASYRIPGIVVTKRGALVAYCEARKTPSDWGRIDVLLRRSTDGGKTWEAPRTVAEPPAGATKNPVALAQKVGRPDEITVNNPVAVADDATGALHLLYCVEYARCFVMRSDDDGRTFSRPTEITAAFEQLRPKYDWKVIATGPGHGIRLRGGRLVVPVWLSTGAGRHAHRPSCVATLYSDDAGTTWKAGDVVVNHPELTNPNESAAAELADGGVMLNIRHEGPQRRAVCVSPDGVSQWSKPRLDEALPDPVCMASMTRSGDALLFCNPENGQSRERKNLTVKISKDDGRTWTRRVVVEPGPSGYSDLAAGTDGTVYCFYERGAVSGNAARPTSLTVVRLNLRP